MIRLTPKRFLPGIPGIFDENTRIPGYFHPKIETPRKWMHQR